MIQTSICRIVVFLWFCWTITWKFYASLDAWQPQFPPKTNDFSLRKNTISRVAVNTIFFLVLLTILWNALWWQTRTKANPTSPLLPHARVIYRLTSCNTYRREISYLPATLIIWLIVEKGKRKEEDHVEGTSVCHSKGNIHYQGSSISFKVIWPESLPNLKVAYLLLSSSQFFHGSTLYKVAIKIWNSASISNYSNIIQRQHPMYHINPKSPTLYIVVSLLTAIQ